MNEQQRYLLKMMREIHEICEKHGIEYFATSGTLIGAVRHGGFLPWDDDADVFMAYGEWQKFKKACETDLPEGRRLVAPELPGDFGHIVPRYLSTETTSIHTCQSLGDDFGGEVIDIFILDPIADGEDEFASYLQDLYMYSAVMCYSNCAGFRVEIDAERFRQLMDEQDRIGQAAMAQKLEAQLAAHFDDSGRYYAQRWQAVQPRYERAWFDHAVPIAFEDTTLMVPCGINEYLTSYFGEDWAEIPAKITASKHNTAFSLVVPCDQALEYYRPTFDRETLREEMRERRTAVFEHAPESNRLRDDRSRARANVAKAELERHLERNRAVFDRALAERDGRTLAFILDDYLAQQTSSDLIGRKFHDMWYRALRPILIDVPDDVFEGALIALMATDRIRFVSRLCEIWEADGRALSMSMQDTLDDVASFRAATNDYQYGNYGTVLSAGRELQRKYPDCPMFAKLTCVAQAQLPDADAFGCEVDRALERWPRDGFFLKLRGDALERSGAFGAARTTYLAAAELTRNGFALKDIAEKTGYHPTWLRQSDWGRAYGIPQWDGDAPELPARRSVDRGCIPEGMAPDARQAYLFGLLAELAGICDANDIPYILCPEAANAFFNFNWYPGTLEGYALLLLPNDLARLEACTLPAQRSFERVDAPAKSLDSIAATLRYHGRDSLLWPATGNEPDAASTLYVTAAPLEPVKYGMLTRALRLAQIGSKQGGKSKKAALLAHIAPSGNRMTKRIGSEAARASSYRCALGGDGLAVSAGMFDAAEPRTFEGASFRVPAGFGDYANLASEKQPAASLRIAPPLICSTSETYKTLQSSDCLPQDYFERKRAVAASQEDAAAYYRHFKRNFNELKLAVKTRELELKLMPRKVEILALAQKRDFAALAPLLADYGKAAKKYKTVGAPVFDGEIHAAYQKLQRWETRHRALGLLRK